MDFYGYFTLLMSDNLIGVFIKLEVSRKGYYDIHRLLIISFTVALSLLRLP